jgi:hypothetical protein
MIDLRQMHARILHAVAPATLAILLTALAHAQSPKLTLLAIDGKNGKPLTAQRLLGFVGKSQEDVRLHKQSMDVTTDKDGVALLGISDANIQWIQVLVDFRTLCQTTPNAQSFRVAEIVANGLAAPNSCGSLRRDLAPGQLIVYSRSATLREKMAW